jgi:hypothetical protein
MLKKLLSIYENSILFPTKPEKPIEQFYIFTNENKNEWIGIPKTSLSEKELTLLKAICELVEFHAPASNSTAKGWDEFLLWEGPHPHSKPGASVRFIQFQINGDGTNQME